MTALERCQCPAPDTADAFREPINEPVKLSEIGTQAIPKVVSDALPSAEAVTDE